MGASGVITLDLSKDHHNVTLVAGVTTITTSGGDMGGSYALVLTQPNAGVTTVGFSTYFLWPAGSAPILGRNGANGEVDMVSFVVKRPANSAVGVTTQLLASAGLNYS